jgi:hypothetical protein
MLATGPTLATPLLPALIDRPSSPTPVTFAASAAAIGCFAENSHTNPSMNQTIASATDLLPGLLSDPRPRLSAPGGGVAQLWLEAFERRRNRLGQGQWRYHDDDDHTERV